jgi:hypothetical protein
MDYILPMAAEDYVSGFPNGNVIDWGSTSILDVIETQTALKSALQSKVGSARFKLRLQFAGTNHDGVADFVTFINPSLIITYTTP